ncbi:hypothetical protein GCM10020331_077360 [Ectobacillus funiculus]
MVTSEIEVYLTKNRKGKGIIVLIHYEELHHIGINVTDLEKKQSTFYSTILCLQEIERPNF